MTATDWNHLRAFLATVEAGSLSSAARRLGLTQPTLSRQIAALEAELGVVLFERIGKRLHLTETGASLAAHVSEMGSVAERFSLAASGQAETVEGVVRITAIDAFAAFVVPPILDRLAMAAPGIVIEVHASNALDDLMRREADIAIRHVPPDQPDLIARRCRDSEMGLYASTGLLDRLGRPQTPSDLGRLPFLGFPDSAQVFAEFAARGIPLTADAMRWSCASVLINWQLILAGVGFGIMFKDMAGDTPGVEQLVPGLPPLIAPVWLVAHRELHTSRRIRLVFDALLAELSHRPAEPETDSPPRHASPAMPGEECSSDSG